MTISYQEATPGPSKVYTEGRLHQELQKHSHLGYWLLTARNLDELILYRNLQRFIGKLARQALRVPMCVTTDYTCKILPTLDCQAGDLTIRPWRRVSQRNF